MRKITKDTLDTVLAIQGHFHALIRERAGRLIDEHSVALPELAALLSMHGERRSFLLVPGMYGGFEYSLVGEGDGLKLATESWCRISDDSERRHEITAAGSVRVE